MSRILVMMFVGSALAACGGGDGTGPGLLSLGGSWSYSETLTDQVHSISCNDAGTVNITQTNSTFTGTFNQTGLCTGPGGSADNSGSGSVTGGQVNGSNVSFQVPFCQYQGTASGGNPPNRMTGTLSCSTQESGTTFNFSGTWQASR